MLTVVTLFRSGNIKWLKIFKHCDKFVINTKFQTTLENFVGTTVGSLSCLVETMLETFEQIATLLLLVVTTAKS
jgi:hypothetical protein